MLQTIPSVILTFDGENPDKWILQAERYFHFHRLMEEEILEATVVTLEGDALRWFQWEHLIVGQN